MDHRIDKENLDSARHLHLPPKGQGPQVPARVAEAVESRNSEKNQQHRRDAVPPPGIYSDFKVRERQAILEMLAKEESKALRRTQVRPARSHQAGGKVT